jgi:hypothetical protein
MRRGGQNDDVANWFRLSWWMKQGSEAGSHWSSDHPVGTVISAYALCALVVVLSLGQAAWRWNGARSAIALATGLAAGTAVVLAAARLKQRSQAQWQSAVGIANVLGALAVIPTLGFAGIPEPGPLLGVSQGLGDGYIAAQFATLIFFIRRPPPGASRA